MQGFAIFKEPKSAEDVIEIFPDAMVFMLAATKWIRSAIAYVKRLDMFDEYGEVSKKLKGKGTSMKAKYMSLVDMWRKVYVDTQEEKVYESIFQTLAENK